MSATVASSTFASTFNVSGLASGLDTNAIVTKLMALERQPQTRIIQKTAVETARVTDLRAIQTQLARLSIAIAGLIDPRTWSTSQQITSSNPNVAATGSGVPPGGFQISVQQLARAAQLTQSTSLSAASGNDQLTIQLGPNPADALTADVLAGDSLQTIADAINAASGTKVFASVVNSKLVLSGQVTGAANTIAVSSTGGGTLAADLGLSSTVIPQDAIYTLDGGAPTTSSSNTLTNIATGLTVTLSGTTSSAATITVSGAGTNTTGAQNALKDFVSAYNDTITLINSKVNERRVVNPRTDADRAQGDLAGDRALKSLVSQLRRAVGSAFSGAPPGLDTLAQAGLSTGAAVGSGMLNQASIQGELTLNTTTLATQLASSLTNVKALFTNPTGSFASEGLSQRVNSILSSYTGASGVLPSEIKSQNSLIARLGAQQSAWDVRLAVKETALRAKFAAMETALSHAQSQGSWLTSQIAKL